MSCTQQFDTQLTHQHPEPLSPISKHKPASETESPTQSCLPLLIFECWAAVGISWCYSSTHALLFGLYLSDAWSLQSAVKSSEVASFLNFELQQFPHFASSKYPMVSALVGYRVYTFRASVLTKGSRDDQGWCSLNWNTVITVSYYVPLNASRLVLLTFILFFLHKLSAVS